MRTFSDRNPFAMLAAVVASVSFLIVGGASAALAHAKTHSTSISGNMHIVDHDWPDANDTGNRAIGPVGQSSPAAYSTGGCVDEVRGTITITFADSSSFPGWLLATLKTRLYEGASCSTNDLDGSDLRTVWLPPNATTSVKFRVNNTDEGDDYIDFTVMLGNSTSV